MKKSISIVFASFIYVFFASSAFGVNITINQPPQTVSGNVTAQSVVNFILNFLAVVGVVAALAYLLYGGIKYITSGGDKQAVENARHHIISAIIGLMVVVLSFVIVRFVFNILGITPDITNLTIPTITG